MRPKPFALRGTPAPWKPSKTRRAAVFAGAAGHVRHPAMVAEFLGCASKTKGGIVDAIQRDPTQ